MFEVNLIVDIGIKMIANINLQSDIFLSGGYPCYNILLIQRSKGSGFDHPHENY